MEKIILRKAGKEDLPDVLALIKELATYEKAPDEVTVSLHDLERDGFGEHPIYKIILAESGGIVGMSFYYYSYSTWKGKCIYIDDIIVKEPFRGKGIGRILFDEMIRIAYKEDARRLHWQVLDWNEPGLNFYRKFDTEFDNAWVNGKLTRESIIKYVENGKE